MDKILIWVLLAVGIIAYEQLSREDYVKSISHYEN